MITKEHVLKVIEKYANAWINQDSNAIIELFSEDATYHEWAFDEPHIGHEGIKKYWEDKVIGEQTEIEFKLLDLYLDNERNAAIAEWEANFYINNSEKKNNMREVAILEFNNQGKIKSLREYWANQDM